MTRALVLVCALLGATSANAEDCSHSCGTGDLDATGCCVGAPKARRPLDNAVSADRTPNFEIVLGSRADATRIEVCRDLACSALVTSWTAEGAVSTGPPLPTGTFFWRANSRRLGSDFASKTTPRRLKITATSTEAMLSVPGRVYVQRQVELATNTLTALVPIDLRAGDRIVVSNVRVKRMRFDTVELVYREVSDPVQRNRIPVLALRWTPRPPGAFAGPFPSPAGPAGYESFMSPIGTFLLEERPLAPGERLIMMTPSLVRSETTTDMIAALGIELPNNLPVPREAVETLCTHVIAGDRLTKLKPFSPEKLIEEWKVSNRTDPPTPLRLETKVTTGFDGRSIKWMWMLPQGTYYSFGVIEPGSNSPFPAIPPARRAFRSPFLGGDPVAHEGVAIATADANLREQWRHVYKFVFDTTTKEPLRSRFLPLFVPFLSNDEVKRVATVSAESLRALGLSLTPTLGARDFLVLVGDVEVFR